MTTSASSKEKGVTSSWSAFSSKTMSGGTTSGLVERSCPNLTKVGPSSSSIWRTRRPRGEPSSPSTESSCSRRESRPPGRCVSKKYPNPCFAATCEISEMRPSRRTAGRVLIARAGRGWLWGAFDEAETVLELGEPELELLALAAGHEAELPEHPESEARPLAHAQRVAAPAPHDIVHELASIVLREPASGGELVRELVGAVLRQRQRADAGEQELLGEVAESARVVVTALVHVVSAPLAPGLPPGSSSAVRPECGCGPRRDGLLLDGLFLDGQRLLFEDRLVLGTSSFSRRPAVLRFAYSGSRSLRMTSSGVAMKIVEYAPEAIPTSRAKAKSFSVSPPKTRSEATGSSVMNVVASERLIVSQSDWLAIAAKLDRRMSGAFSRTRSKMMIVS